MLKAIVMPTLLRRVLVVLSLGAYAKVRRIYAWRVVAGVHDDLPLWNRSYEKLIRVAMGADRYFAGKKENTVAVPILRARPKPASISLFDAGFKYVIRAGEFVFSNCLVRPCFAVAAAAQFPANNFARTAFDALDDSGLLVTHDASVC